MRTALLLVSLIALPSAAVAAPDPRSMSEIEQTLRDPAMAQKVSTTLQSLTDALLDLKVGPMKAALEGREATAEDRTLTVGELDRRKGRDPEAIRRQIRDTGPAIARGMNGLADALPVMSKAIADVQRAVERAAANMPDPSYPRR